MDRNQRVERPDATFQGFRVVRVENNVITRVEYVTLNDLRATGDAGPQPAAVPATLPTGVPDEG
jgi:hypothetical protein